MGKGAYIVVILSVVWTIVSAIMEKRKAASKKKAMYKDGAETQPRVEVAPKPVYAANPEDVRVEALRRRSRRSASKFMTSSRKQPAPPLQSRSAKPIRSMHQQDCPVPPTRFGKSSIPSAAHQITAMLHDRRNLRTAIVLAEVLGKPIALRK